MSESTTPMKDFFKGMGLAGGATVGIVIAIILIICITCFSCAFISGFRDDGAFQNTIEQLK